MLLRPFSPFFLLQEFCLTNMANYFFNQAATQADAAENPNARVYAAAVPAPASLASAAKNDVERTVTALAEHTDEPWLPPVWPGFDVYLRAWTARRAQQAAQPPTRQRTATGALVVHLGTYAHDPLASSSDSDIDDDDDDEAPLAAVPEAVAPTASLDSLREAPLAVAVALPDAALSLVYFHGSATPSPAPPTSSTPDGGVLFLDRVAAIQARAAQTTTTPLDDH